VNLDREVAELLDGRPDLLALADAVSATQTRRPARYTWRVLAVAAAAALAIALALSAPWRGHGNSVVQRALAAVGGAHVLHTVVERPLTGTDVVDLATGRETSVEQRFEYWYDSASRTLRYAITIRGSLVGSGDVHGARADVVDPALTGFLNDYRKALTTGDARQTGTGMVDGHHVLWLTLENAGLFGERVAIDASSFKPVLVEQLNADGTAALPVTHVLEITTATRIPPGLAAPKPRVPFEGRGSALPLVPTRRLAQTLGWTPLWLGASFQGLARGAAQPFHLTLTIGPRTRTVKTFYVGYGPGTIQIQEALEPVVDGYQVGAVTPESDLGVPMPAPGYAVVSSGSGGLVFGNAPQQKTCRAQLRVGKVWVAISARSSTACLAAAKALRPVP
jgi:hypothetical protein